MLFDRENCSKNIFHQFYFILFGNIIYFKKMSYIILKRDLVPNDSFKVDKKVIIFKN